MTTIVSSDWSAAVPFMVQGVGNAYVESAKIAPSTLAANDGFGRAVAISGDGLVMLVGACLDDSKATDAGIVYHYAKISGSWVLQGKINASDFAASDYFGVSCALNADGTYAMIGSVLDDDKGTDSGSVYLFTRSGNVWTQVGKLYSDDCSAGDQFGVAIGMAGDASFCVIGSCYENRFGTTAGAAYFFRNVNGTWVQHQKVFCSDAPAGSLFGNAVAMSRDGVFAAVGATLSDVAGTDCGSLYIYKMIDGFYVEQNRIVPPDVAASIYFGAYCALDETGSTLIVSATGDAGRGAGAGALYFFDRNGSLWVPRQKMMSSDGIAADELGCSVAVSGDGNTIIAGARGVDSIASNAGAIYVFDRSTLTYTYEQSIRAYDGADSDYFGCSVALNADATVALIGCYLDDDQASNSGSVYFFTRSGGTWTFRSKIYPGNPSASCYFGVSVAISGDGNYALIGTTGDDDKATNSGAVYVFTRTNDIWTQQTKLYASDPVSGTNFGVSVALNSDATIALIGNDQDGTKASMAGAVYMFTRVGTAWSQQQKFYANDASATSYFGHSCTLSADGTIALIGAFMDDVKASDGGAVYMFTRSGNAWTQTQKFYSSDDKAADSFGVAVAVNADATIAIIFSQGDRDKGLNAGAGYVFTRTDSTWTQKTKFYSANAKASGFFGTACAMSADASFIAVGCIGDGVKANFAGAVQIFISKDAYADATFESKMAAVDKLAALDAAVSDSFGGSIALSSDGNYALVGAIGNDDKGSSAGCVYVYTKVNGVWTQQQKLYASDAASNDYFGISCAVNADATIALIGAHYDDKGADTGSVYVFTRVDTVWTQQRKLYASDAAAGDYFGVAIAVNIDATIALIGAHADDDKGTDTGSVYVFTRVGNVWTQQQKIYASDAIAIDYFGISIALNSDASYALIGAIGRDDKATDAGAVYVFTRSGNVWSQQQKLYASDAATTDYFGISCALNADATYALIGANTRDDKGPDTGCLYSFTRIGAVWTQVSKIYAPDAAAGDQFGRSVVLSGNSSTFLVGAQFDDEAYSDQGSVYVFEMKSVQKTTPINYGLLERKKIMPDDSSANDYFGVAIAVNADATIALVGAHADDDRATDSGSVYVFSRNKGSWTQQQKLTPPDGAASDLFGSAVALSGDGQIALIGAMYSDAVASNAGCVYFYKKNGDDWVFQSKIVASDGTTNDNLGYGIALNSDGTYALISAFADDDTATDSGSVYAFARVGNTWVQQQKLNATDAKASAFFGSSVAMTADATLAVIGCQSDSAKGTNAGSAYVFSRTGSVWTQRNKFYSPDIAAGDYFGVGLAMTADGKTVAISAQLKADYAGNSGILYIFEKLGFSYVYKKKIFPSDPSGAVMFGKKAAFSADGKILLVGSDSDTDKVSKGGSVTVFMDGSIDYASTNDAKIIQRQKIWPQAKGASGTFGRCVSVSGDGSTLVIGEAATTDGSLTNAGRVNVYKKVNGNWAFSASFYPSDVAAGDLFGISASVNYDGTHILIGASASDVKGTDAGAVYAFSLISGVWTQVQKFYSGTPANGVNFGYAIGMSSDGSVAVISQCLDQTAATSAGAVLIFVRAANVWRQRQIIYPHDAVADLWYGTNVAMSGDGNVMLVGASRSNNAPGRIYVYFRLGDVYHFQQCLYQPEGTTGDYFSCGGCGLNNNGDIAVIGAQNDSDKGTNSGSIYVFTRINGVWSYRRKLTANDTIAGSAFGIGATIAFQGNAIYAGAHSDTDFGTASGAAYAFDNKLLPADVPNQSGYSFGYKFTARDSVANDSFGRSVALNSDGTYALMSSYLNDDKATDSGCVYVFVKSGNVWLLQQKLYTSDPAVGDLFGVSCALNADASVAVIGAYGKDDKGTDSGCIYVFTRVGSTWTQQQKLYASDGAAYDYFGVGIAVNSDASIILVGADGDDDKGDGTGSVYVFIRSGVTWVRQQKIYATDPVAGDNFGVSVAVNADATIALIGASNRDDKATDAGCIYVFTRSGNVWTQQQKLYASDAAASDYFGIACTLNADASYAAVAAYADDDKGSNSGSVYIFMRTGNIWTQVQKVTANDGAASDTFGICVTMSSNGENLFIGTGGDSDKASSAGSVYVYVTGKPFQVVPSATGYVNVDKVTAFDAAASDYFGSAVAISADGSYAIVGSNADDDKGVDSGSAYVFTKSGNAWTYQQKLYASDPSASDRFGTAVAMNGDGSYVIVGAYADDDKGMDSGSAYVFTRVGTVWTQQQKLTASDGVTTDYFGYSAALNSNASIALIGAHQRDDKGTDAGSVYVFTRSGNTWTQQQKLYASDATTSDWFGMGCALNSDASYALIGAPGDDDLASNSGSVYVFVQSGGVWTQKTKLLPSDGAANDWFGVSVALNADATIALIGASFDDDKGTNSGSVYVFVRTGDAWTQKTKLLSQDEEANDLFGNACSISGDGSMVLIGALQDDDKATDAGAFYFYVTDALFTASFDSVKKPSAVTLSIDNTLDVVQKQKLLPTVSGKAGSFGIRVSMSRDGQYMAVGESGKTSGGLAGAGCVSIYAKVSGSWVFQTELVPSDQAANNYFGVGVAMNQDGTLLLAGRYRDGVKAADSGAVYVFTRTGATWTQVQKFYANDPVATDYFGHSIVMNAAGTIAFICAPGNDDVASMAGAVYVFVRGNGAGTWRQQQKIKAPDGIANDFFGAPVSTDATGNHLFIAVPAYSGSPRVEVYFRASSQWVKQTTLIVPPPSTAITTWLTYDIAVNSDASVAVISISSAGDLGTNAGASHIFTRNGPVWSYRRRFYGKDTVAADQYGVSATVSGDGLEFAVGSSQDNECGTSGGSVSIFTNKMKASDIANPSGFLQYRKFVATDARASGWFGVSVALNADATVALIGAHCDGDKATNAGAAYIFTRAGGVWTQQQKLYASDAAVSDYFGISVALNSDATMALIGAHCDDDAATDSGSVYVFTRLGSVWTQQQKLHANDPVASDYFGVSCALNADATYAVIGAQLKDDKATDAGCAYVFTRNGTAWTQVTKLYASDAAASDQFGISVAVNADATIIFVGAAWDDDKGADSGSVYIFTRSGTVFTQQQKINAGDGSAGDVFGISVALNGDGTVALVGAILDDDKATDSGSVSVFTRVGTTWTHNAKLTANDESSNDNFGRSVALSADGSFALIGSSADDDRGVDAGSVYFFAKEAALAYSNDQDTSVVQTKKMLPQTAGLAAGYGVSVSVNQDNTIMLVGECLATVGGVSSCGAVNVYTKPASDWVFQQTLTASDKVAGDLFGAGVALNSDATIALISAPQTADKGSYSGSVYAFTRSGTVWTQQQKFYAPDASTGDNFGNSVAISADGNYAVIGATYDDDRGTDSGSVYVFTRSGNVWTLQSKLTDPNGKAGDYFGNRSAINSNGEYMAITAPGVTNTGYGSVSIWKRLGTSWTMQQRVQVPGLALNASGKSIVGVALNGASDILAVGITNDAAVGANSGSVAIFTRRGGTWTYRKMVRAVDEVAGSVFGTSCALDALGQTLYSGATGDSESGANSGALYNFTNSLKATDIALPVGLSQVEKIDVPGALASDYVGDTVAISGDGLTMLVGLRGRDTPTTDAGCVSYYSRTTGSKAWTYQSSITASDGAVSDNFGSSVALNNDATIALIGAYLDDDKGVDSGSVYVFTRSGAVWTQQQKLTAGDGVATDWFGVSVTLNADATYAIVGAHGRDDKAADAGAAYVFTRSGGVWTQQTKIYASDAAANDYFGVSCALNSDATMALIGSPYDDDKGLDTGSIYIFTRSGTVWTQQQKLTASDAVVSDNFGRSVTLSADGSFALIGANGRDDKGVDSGAVYAFTRNGNVWTETRKIVSESELTGDGFGMSVSLTADASIAVIGACYDDEVYTDQGSVYVFADLAVHAEFI